MLSFALNPLGVTAVSIHHFASPFVEPCRNKIFRYSDSLFRESIIYYFGTIQHFRTLLIAKSSFKMSKMKVSGIPNSKQYYVDSNIAHMKQIESKSSPKSSMPAISLVTAATTIEEVVVPVSANTCHSNSGLKVFMYWGQGWQSACPLAKICFESWKFVPSVELVPLHEAQVSKLLEKQFGPEKMRKFRNLSHQMKSDIVRLRILYHMGGIWADASLFASGDVVEWLRAQSPAHESSGSGLRQRGLSV